MYVGEMVARLSKLQERCADPGPWDLGSAESGLKNRRYKTGKQGVSQGERTTTKYIYKVGFETSRGPSEAPIGYWMKACKKRKNTQPPAKLF